MATTTPLNGWPVPTSTDYVKDGATAIEALGDAIDTSVGEGLLAWQSYTPTFTNFTLGNGTINRAEYAHLGKLVFLEVVVTLGSTSAVSGRIGVSLPVTAQTAPNLTNATCQLNAGAVSGVGSMALALTTRLDLYAIVATTTTLTNGNISATVPGTWANGSTFSFKTFYEAA
jgi:hypothetical protein